MAEQSLANVLRATGGPEPIRSFVKYGGPVPAPLQQYTTYDAAVTAKTTAPDAAAELLKMIAGIPAQKHWKSAGMEPVH